MHDFYNSSEYLLKYLHYYMKSGRITNVRGIPWFFYTKEEKTMCKQTNLSIETAKLEMNRANHELMEASKRQSYYFDEMMKLWDLIATKQAIFDELKAQNCKDWEDYKARMSDYTKQVGDLIEAIKESFVLAEKMAQLGKDKTGQLAKVYSTMNSRAVSYANELKIMKNELLEKRRTLREPAKEVAPELLEELKDLRRAHKEMNNKYHEAKNERTHREDIRDRVREKINMMMNSEEPDASSVPTKYVPDNDTIMKVGIPKKYIGNVEASRRADGFTDYYFGEDIETRHGHIVTNEKGEVTYIRMPEPVQWMNFDEDDSNNHND